MGTMFNQSFVISGSSLKLLKIGEQGIVSNWGRVDDRTVQKLRAMGITPGTSITLEQRSPRFMVKVRCNRFALSEEIIRAIYVRVVGSETKHYGIRRK
jgi:ferrous iron transport protein A